MCDLIRTLAAELLKVPTEAAYLTSGAVLLGLIDGLDPIDTGDIIPIPVSEVDQYNVGWQVGESLMCGASRHL